MLEFWEIFWELTLSNKNLADKFKKVTSVEELIHCAENGVEVFCPSVSYLEKPKKAESVMNMSGKSLVKLIGKGLYAKGIELGAPEGSLLGRVQAKVASTGLSHSDIAKLVGMKRQQIGQFMSASSVQTRTLEKICDGLGI